MSVRLTLEFNGKTLRAQDIERMLVEKHMCIWLSVDPGFETAITIAPSEPLLAEVSYLLMQSPAFDLPHSLLTELELPGLDKGSCGELIVMTLCLEARDTAAKRLQSRVIPVNDFIRELLAETSHEDILGSKPIIARTCDEANKTFEDTFCNSGIYFNHFIKQSELPLASNCLWSCCSMHRLSVWCGHNSPISFLGQHIAMGKRVCVLHSGKERQEISGNTTSTSF
jgi:hypothetical protein